MIKAAGQELVRHLPTQNDKNASLLPPISESRWLARFIGQAVGKQAIQDGQGAGADEAALTPEIEANTWEPVYVPYQRKQQSLRQSAISVPAAKLWGPPNATFARTLQHRRRPDPREMIAAYAIFQKICGQQFVPQGVPRWKPEHGVEFNSLLDFLTMLLLQPVIQYYANVGGRSQSAVVFGFRTKIEF